MIAFPSTVGRFWLEDSTLTPAPFKVRAVRGPVRGYGRDNTVVTAISS